MSDFTPSVPPPKTTGGGWRWEPPSPAELQQILPQYEVHMLIGRGGMGAVYKGTQLSLDRAVAIKLLPPAIEQQDLAFAERFKNEARLMGRMNHPAIVSVYDFGRTSDGQLYFVMEYVDGTDVQRMIAREGKLPPEHALAITAHLCDALGYAHKQGIVHRDIKPSNVLIDLEGRVKVADFGLAKLADKGLNSGLTQTGMAMGTPDYVAPETLTFGSDVDGRADIYAVGVMLYQMLTGDIPRGMFKMPSQKFQSIDPRFDAIVRRALEHDREERYQSSHELRLALDVILTTPRAEPGRESSAALPKQSPPPHTPGRTVVPSSRNPGSSPQQRTAPQPPPYEPPPPRKPESSSTLPYVIFALLMLGGGGWFIVHQQPSGTAPAPSDSGDTASSLSSSSSSSEPKKTGAPPPKPAPAPPKGNPAPVTRPSTSGGSSSTASSASRPTTPVPPTPVPTTPPPAVTPPATTPPASGNESIASRLSQLESQFQSAFEREVNVSYTEQLSTLGTGYLSALDRATQDATKAGRLDEAVALREEKQRFTDHKFMPSIDPASLHKTVVTLRNAYRSAEKKYAQQKDTSSLPLYDRYIEVLNALEKEVLTQGRTADVTAVRTKRDDVVTRRKQRAAKAQTGASTTPPPSPASAKLALFDGRTLSGWRILGDADSFIAVDGEIRSNSRPGNLVYVGPSGVAPLWKDFSLEIKVKCQDKSNSGIWLHIPDPITILSRKVSAFEVNIDESADQTGSILGAVEMSTGAPLNSRLERGGDRFGSSKSFSDSQMNQWLSMRVTSRSGLVTVWIDGRQVNQWSLPSGWAPPPEKNYLQTFQGTIGLQSMSGRVAFKDIILELL
ncbi:protein kinase domain-containing protein [Prosthecobacter sp.]|uniref:protein kinase domain-containing protein n=1 Tax=Prosthecobacter sp. TaxID=1965333 RepID=UPI00378506BF